MKHETYKVCVLHDKINCWCILFGIEICICSYFLHVYASAKRRTSNGMSECTRMARNGEQSKTIPDIKKKWHGKQIDELQMDDKQISNVRLG